MIDIFDIMKETKNHHINIEGTVSDSYVGPFTIGDLTVLIDILRGLTEDEIEIKELRTSSYDHEDYNSLTGYGIYGNGLRRNPIIATTSTDFRIDVLLTQTIYERIYAAFGDFIDYFTVGAIAVDWFKNEWEREMTITTDPYEEYRSSSEEVHFDIDIFDSSFDRDSLYYRGNEDYSLGSYAINHDADGDVATLASSFRPTDMNNMFSNMVLNLELDRPVVSGGGRH